MLLKLNDEKKITGNFGFALKKTDFFLSWYLMSKVTFSMVFYDFKRIDFKELCQKAVLYAIIVLIF